MKNTIAIIGCGNLGLSILNGLLETENISPTQLTVTRRNIASLQYLDAKGVCVTTDNRKAVSESEIIIFALKPYKLLEVMQDLKEELDFNKHIIVSLATGISLKEINVTLGEDFSVFRAMPNTAADVKMSMTCISSFNADDQTINKVKECFNSIGDTIIIDEELMDSATVLGACGIAYVLRFIRGMIQGGIEIGFDAKIASKIVTQTVKGASELLIQRKEHPEFEIDKVTTPKGCTIAGLNEMEHNGFSSALIKGIVTSYNKIEK